MERQEYDVVRARRFEVVDEQERVRAAIGSGPDGRTGIQVYGTDGEVRAELSVLGGEGGENSTLLSLRDKSGQDKAIIGVGEGIPAIGLSHSGEQPEESWEISLLGEDPDDPKFQRCSLMLSQGGKPHLMLTLLGEDNSPHVLMREGESLSRVLP